MQPAWDHIKDVLHRAMKLPPTLELSRCRVHVGRAERFRLLHPLGEGGMGHVWLAEQLAPVNRRVALKLVKAGMYDAAMLQRFLSERQSLAPQGHHPSRSETGQHSGARDRR